jgi:hypothetical protein
MTTPPKQPPATPAVTPRQMVGGFAWFMMVAYELALSAGGPTCALTYLGLCIRQSMAASSGKIEFFASLANIARAAGISARAVARYIPLLEKCGLVVRISGRHGGEGRAHQANRWILVHRTDPARGGLPLQLLSRNDAVAMEPPFGK